MIQPAPLSAYRPRPPGTGLRAVRPLPEMCAVHPGQLAKCCPQCALAAAPKPERGVERQTAQHVAANVIAKVDRRRVEARSEPKLPPPPRVPVEARRAAMTVVPGERVKNGTNADGTQRYRASRRKLTDEQRHEQAVKRAEASVKVRKLRTVELDGVQVVVLHEAPRRGLKPVVVRKRIAKGWTVRQAFGIDAPPPRMRNWDGTRRGGVPVTLDDGRVVPLAVAARMQGMRKGCASKRVRAGWTSRQAVGLDAPPIGSASGPGAKWHRLVIQGLAALHGPPTRRMG